MQIEKYLGFFCLTILQGITIQEKNMEWVSQLIFKYMIFSEIIKEFLLLL